MKNIKFPQTVKVGSCQAKIFSAKPRYPLVLNFVAVVL